MTPESQRIAIAKACPENIRFIEGGNEWCWRPSTNHAWRRCYLNDPLNDLNAMHEAEKVHWNNQVFRQLYRGYLLGLTNDRLGQAYDPTGDEWSNTIHATAAQRAEAFLRTLGLWKEIETN